MSAEFGRRIALTALFTALPLAAVLGWTEWEGAIERERLERLRVATEQNFRRILQPVTEELALARRFARLDSLRQWLLDSGNPAKRRRFLAEAKSSRSQARDHAWFVVERATLDHYYQDDGLTESEAPRNRLDASDPASSAWFFNMMRDTEDYEVNVDTDVTLGISKVWFNIVVRDGDRKLAAAGTGLDLTHFLRDFVADGSNGIELMVLNADGVIILHPDSRMITFNAVSDITKRLRTVYDLLADAASQDAVRRTLREAVGRPGSAVALPLPVHVLGRPRLLAAAYSAELRWYIVAASQFESR